MAVEALAPLVEALTGVIAWIADLALLVFASCARSIRYAFSASYRETVNARLQNRGALYRAAYASWGIFAVACTFTLLALIAHRLLAPGPTPAEACARIELRQLSGCVQAVRESLQR